MLKVGDRFNFKGFEWIVLDNNVDGGVLAIMAEHWKVAPFDDNCNNDYRISSLRQRLFKELLPILGEENLMPHVVDLTADNGDDTYGVIMDKVFILSCDEYRRYREHIPLLKEWSWTCTPWFINPHTGNGHFVRAVNGTGGLDDYDANYNGGVSPVCVFKLKTLKDISVNQNKK